METKMTQPTQKKKLFRLRPGWQERLPIRPILLIAGLRMAEIELGSPDEPFERPSWLGKEVTDDMRYYNGHLARHPFKTW